MNLESIVNFINSKIPENPKTGIILGSGIGSYIESLENKIVISYSSIPGHLQTTVSGHSGQWVFGYEREIPVICANGRFHIYEGFSNDQVNLPVSVINQLGCKRIIITNSAGCLNLDWKIGDFMLIRSYIDYTFRFSKCNPKIIDLKLKKTLLKHIHNIALKVGVPLKEGIYTWTLGPSYETPAEIEDIISLGGNAVGMSTVPEIIKATDLNADIIGISCFTNYGAGLDNKRLSHLDVLRVSSDVSYKLKKLIQEII